MAGNLFRISKGTLITGVSANTAKVIKDGPRVAGALTRIIELEGLTSLTDFQVVYLVTLSVIVDNETGWLFGRELSFVNSLSERYRYIYSVYRYQDNAQLGNGPRILSLGEEDNSYKYRGSFFPQLTGRANFKRISDNLQDDIDDISRRSSVSCDLSPRKALIDMTNAEIDQAVKSFDYNYAVTRCYYRLRLNVTIHSKVQDTIRSLVMRMIIANGYPKSRKYWSSGAYTPSRADMLNRVNLLLLNLNNLKT